MPVGALAELSDGEGSIAREDSLSGGVVPAAGARYGLRRDVDLGLMVFGPLVRMDVRVARELARGFAKRSQLIPDFAAYAGYVNDADTGDGVRLGVDLPVHYAINFGSILELWTGPRLGAEHIAGLERREGLRHVRVGWTAGFAAGFRHFHALLELSSAYEWWRGERLGNRVARQGVSLTPGFAVRVRL